ncbi:MAG TPA: hypothetical protein VLA24_05790 [Pseudomonadales bacterium]|nr:hypothetical protein [Pseudomonadales bacterium]
MRFGHFALPLSLAVSLLSTPILAQDDPRIMRMQQTIQELTLQLGDAIRDNAALRKQLDSRGNMPERAMMQCEPSVERVPVAPHHTRGVTSEPITPPSEPQVTQRALEEAPVLQCDIAALEQRLSQFSDPTTRETALNTWLEDNGSQCSRGQLQQLRGVASKVTLSDDATALIDYYMSKAR